MTPSGTTDENVRIVKSAIDALNAHDLNRFRELHSENFTLYTPASINGAKGEEAISEDVGRDLVACPDLQFKLDRILGAGEWVIAQGLLNGTNTGPLISLKGKQVRATGKRVEVRQALLHRVEAGKIIETHQYYDQFQADAQLGIRKKAETRLMAYLVAGLVILTVAGLASLLHLGIIPDSSLFGLLFAGVWLISVSAYLIWKLTASLRSQNSERPSKLGRN